MIVFQVVVEISRPDPAGSTIDLGKLVATVYGTQLML